VTGLFEIVGEDSWSPISQDKERGRMKTKGIDRNRSVRGRTEKSWAKLHKKWTPRLRQTVQACLCDGNRHLRNDVDDVLQCVWIRIFKGLSSCRWTGVQTWLTTTARRATLNYIRDNSALPNLQDMRLASDVAARGFDGYSKIQHDELWAEVNELPEAHRDVISRHIDGYETEEMATALGVEPAAVRKRLSRARTELRSRLKMASSARRIPGHRRS
jgi:RNA polymerase sigma factor (sigma-70 family)